jgi:hypothetical protein
MIYISKMNRKKKDNPDEGCLLMAVYMATAEPFNAVTINR